MVRNAGATTHQGRKTFARFVGRRDRTGLHALQANYGHVSRIMTDRAYVGTDFDLAELIDAQTTEETRAALEELLTATRLAGKGGHQIAARSPFRGRTRDGDVQQYVALLKRALDAEAKAARLDRRTAQLTREIDEMRRPIPLC